MNGGYALSRTPSPADDPLERLDRVRHELMSVADDEPDTGTIDLGRAGVAARGIPRWAMGLIGGALAVGALAMAVAWAVSMIQR